jgi:hypothetical protein
MTRPTRAVYLLNARKGGAAVAGFASQSRMPFERHWREYGREVLTAKRLANFTYPARNSRLC